MKTVAMSMIAVLVACLPSAGQTRQDKLAFLIPHLYGADGLVLPNEFHHAHFQSSFQQSFTPLNSAVATQTEFLPLASPASGFLYVYDSSLGVYNRSRESLGPILTERAETIGRHRLFVAATYQYFSFSTLDGIRLKNFPTVFTHEAQTGAPYEKDFIFAKNSIDLNINQFTLFSTFGLTDRIDVSVAVPILGVHFGVASDATIERIAPPSPQFGQAHFFDSSDPNGSVRKTFANNQTASGIGDVTFRVKWTAIRGETSALALAADIRTPTGDAYNFLGTGAVGFRPFVAGSFHTGPVAPHVNVGYQFNGKSVLAGDVVTATKARLPGALTYGAGVDIGASRRATFALDLLGDYVVNGPRVSKATYTDALGATFPQIALNKESFNILNGAAGVKVNLTSSLLLTANAIFKLNNAGLRANVIPMVGLSYSF